MFDPEHSQYEEYAYRPPEVMAPPEETFRAEEQQRQEEYPLPAEEFYRPTGERRRADRERDDNKQDRQRSTRRPRSVGMQAMQMLAVTVAGAAVITVAAAQSNGAFLPALGEAANSAYAAVAAIPLVDPGPGMDVQEVVLAFGGQDVTLAETPAPPASNAGSGENSGNPGSSGSSGSTGSDSPAPVLSATDEPQPSPTPEPSPEETPSPSPSPSATPSPRPSSSPRPTPKPSPKPTPSPKPSESTAVAPPSSPSPEIIPTPTPEVTPEPTPTPEATPTPAPTPSPSPEPTPTPTPTPPKPKPDPHYHSYSAEVTTLATCTADGVTTYSCYCGSSYTEAIPATGHSEDAGTVTPATCMVEGATVYKCTVCQQVVRTDTIAKQPHSWGPWQNTNDPANHSRVCSVGGETDNEPHVLVDSVISPTCTAEGYTNHTCACGYVLKDTAVAKLPHTYGAWGDAANGNHVRTCTACSNAESEAHQWGAIGPGPGDMLHEHTCNLCPAKETLQHNYTYTDKGDGNHTKTCTLAPSTETADFPHTFTGGVCVCGATDTPSVALSAEDVRFTAGGITANWQIVRKNFTTAGTVEVFCMSGGNNLLNPSGAIISSAPNPETLQVTLTGIDAYLSQGFALTINIKDNGAVVYTGQWSFTLPASYMPGDSVTLVPF